MPCPEQERKKESRERTEGGTGKQPRERRGMERERRIGYMRVSTREQNEDRQRIALVKAGVPEENIFMDKLSGKDFNRPEYSRMVESLGSGSVLYIKSIDRLGRNYKELNEQWRIITKERQADICVLDMPILDTRREKSLIGTLISDIVLSLLSYVAENERASTKQRQAEGIAAAKARGVRFGRPPVRMADDFGEVAALWEDGRIGISGAVSRLGVSESTFYRRLREYRAMKELEAKVQSLSGT